MFRAFGIVIVLYAITQFMSEPFAAFGDAVTATFEAVEQAALLSEARMEHMK